MYPTTFKRFGVAVAFSLLAGCASKAPQVAIPANLSAPSGEKHSFTLVGKGVQIYECRAGTDGKQAWAFVAPEADLFDTSGRPAGKHYGGPTWEGLDGSKTVGSVKQRADAPQAKDIPWLLLENKSTGPSGVMSTVKSIQRVTTVGGVTPAKACATSNTGEKARVPYVADYLYFVSR